MPQAQTVAIPHRWPLVNRLQTRSPAVPLTKDARLINCYAEFDQEDKDYWIYKRLGIAPNPTYSTTFGGVAGGIFTYSPTTLISSTTNYIVYYIGAAPTGTGSGLYEGTPSSGSTFIGTLAPIPGTITTQYPFFFENVIDGTTPNIVMNNGVCAYIIEPVSATLTQISAISFPYPHCPGWAVLDGTLYVMDPSGNIFGSGINAPTSWNALNVIKASSKSDNGIALFTQLSYVVAFKQWTTQIFYDAANPTGSPLSPVPDAQIPVGCLSANSIQKIDDELIWMSSNQIISPQIIKMQNLTTKIVSTPSIERILDNIAFNYQNPGIAPYTLSTVRSWSFKHNGHRFYGLTSLTLNITLVYDIDQDIWQIWSDPSGNYWPMMNFAYAPMQPGLAGLHLAQDYLTGNVYAVDGDYSYPNDKGVLYPVDIYTPNISGGTARRKTLNMMYFESDVVVGSVMQTRYSDDDYNSWSNFREVDLSVQKPFLDNEGTFENRRAYHLRHMRNTPFRIKAGQLQLDVGVL